jgi:hypothetical protein
MHDLEDFLRTFFAESRTFLKPGLSLKADLPASKKVAGCRFQVKNASQDVCFFMRLGALRVA